MTSGPAFVATDEAKAETLRKFQRNVSRKKPLPGNNWLLSPLIFFCAKCFFLAFIAWLFVCLGMAL